MLSSVVSEDSIYGQLSSPPGVRGRFAWPIRLGSLLLFVGTVVVNYVVGTRIAAAAAAYHLFVSPPEAFFTIWAAIYILLAASVLYNLIRNECSPRYHLFFAVANLINAGWVLLFGAAEHQPLAAYACALLLLLLACAVLMAWVEIGSGEFSIYTYFHRNVFAFYLGWLLAALNVNLGIVLVYGLGVSFRDQLVAFWVATPLTAVAAFTLNGIREGRRGLLSSFCLWFSVIWALVGAAITSEMCLNRPSVENKCIPH